MPYIMKMCPLEQNNWLTCLFECPSCGENVMGCPARYNDNDIKNGQFIWVHNGKEWRYEVPSMPPICDSEKT